jgi:capsid protein
MSVAQQVIYKDTFIQQFETRESVLRQAVTTDVEVRGGQVYFLVAGSGGASAVSRGSNGLIPSGDDSQTQVPITFAEAHRKIVRNGFDIFRAQGPQLEIMRADGMAVINRKIDRTILDAAETGTVTITGATAFTKQVANILVTKLRNAHAGEDTPGNVFGLLSPAAFSDATDITSFANSLYSKTGGKVDEGIPVMGRWVFWEGAYWGVHTGLTGVGTASCTCLIWHKQALGHAISSGSINAEIGRIPWEDQSYALHSIYQGAAKLQNAGIVKWTHDDSVLS